MIRNVRNVKNDRYLRNAKGMSQIHTCAASRWNRKMRLFSSLSGFLRIRNVRNAKNDPYLRNAKGMSRIQAHAATRWNREMRVLYVVFELFLKDEECEEWMRNVKNELFEECKLKYVNNSILENMSVVICLVHVHDTRNQSFRIDARSIFSLWSGISAI